MSDPVTDKAKTWVWLVERIGLPTLFVGALLWGLYGMGKWSAENILLPMFQAQQENTKTTAAGVLKQADALDKQTEALQTISVRQEEIAGHSKEQTELLRTAVEQNKTLIEEVRKKGDM